VNIIPEKTRVHPRIAAWPPRGFTSCSPAVLAPVAAGPWLNFLCRFRDAPPEKNEHSRHRRRQPTPEEQPLRAGRTRTRDEPPARAEAAD